MDGSPFLKPSYGLLAFTEKTQISAPPPLRSGPWSKKSVNVCDLPLSCLFKLIGGFTLTLDKGMSSVSKEVDTLRCGHR